MSSVIIDLLGKSPIKPLQEHIEKTFECTQLLGEFLQASANNDWEQASALQARIVDRAATSLPFVGDGLCVLS